MRFVTSPILGSIVGISQLAISFFVICALFRLLYSSVQTSITSARTESTSIATVLTASVTLDLISSASVVNVTGSIHCVFIEYQWNEIYLPQLSVDLCWFADYMESMCLLDDGNG